MPTVPVEEYLHTLYRPDCDYVEGELVDRNVGLLTHQMAIREVLFYFYERRSLWDIFVILSLRVRISPSRYRVPDVLVVLGPEPNEQILTKPPFLCLEVLSPEDRVGEMQERIDDYLRWGVRFCVANRPLRWQCLVLWTRHDPKVSRRIPTHR